LLVRHAQSLANVDKNTLLNVADHAIDISEEGREQVCLCVYVCFVWLFKQTKMNNIYFKRKEKKKKLNKHKQTNKHKHKQT